MRLLPSCLRLSVLFSPPLPASASLSFDEHDFASSLSSPFSTLTTSGRHPTSTANMQASRLSSLDRPPPSFSSHLSSSSSGGVWRRGGGRWRGLGRDDVASSAARTGEGDLPSFGRGGAPWAGSGAGGREWATSRTTSRGDEKGDANAVKPAEEEPVKMWKGVEYIPAQPRQRSGKVTALPPPPSDEYLAASLKWSRSDPDFAARFPPVIVLSLTHTLLQRKQRSSSASLSPLVRPYLSTFLEYISGQNPETGSRRFRPVVFSSAHAHNVYGMLFAVNLVPPFELPIRGSKTVYCPDAAEGDVLEAIVCREHAGLNKLDFRHDIVVSKDLTRVSAAVKLGKAREDVSYDTRMARRILLVDEDERACPQQPYNHLSVSPFALHDSDFPSKAGQPVDDFGAPLAIELDKDHPLADESGLLSAIYLLERLRTETNIANALRHGFVRNIRDEIKRTALFREKKELSEKQVDAALAEKGREVCREQGIEIRRAWDAQWREKLLEKEGRVLSKEVLARQQAQKQTLSQQHVFARAMGNDRKSASDAALRLPHRPMTDLARQTEHMLKLEEDHEDERERRAFAHDEYDDYEDGW